MSLDELYVEKARLGTEMNRLFKECKGHYKKYLHVSQKLSDVNHQIEKLKWEGNNDRVNEKTARTV